MNEKQAERICNALEGIAGLLAIIAGPSDPEQVNAPQVLRFETQDGPVEIRG